MKYPKFVKKADLPIVDAWNKSRGLVSRFDQLIETWQLVIIKTGRILQGRGQDAR